MDVNQNHQGIAVIFQTEATCKKVYDSIQKHQVRLSFSKIQSSNFSFQNSNLIDEDEEDQIFQKWFFIPVVQECENNEVIESQLADIILGYLKLLTPETRIPFLRILRIINSKIASNENFDVFLTEYDAQREQTAVSKVSENRDPEANVSNRSDKSSILESSL